MKTNNNPMHLSIKELSDLAIRLIEAGYPVDGAIRLVMDVFRADKVLEYVVKIKMEEKD